MNNKNFIIAIALMALILWGGVYIQNILYPPTPQTSRRPEASADTTQSGMSQQQGVQRGTIISAGDDVPEREFTYQNDIMRVRFSSVNASVISLELLQYRDKDKPVQMIINDSSDMRMFDIAFGDAQTEAVSANFIRKEQNNSHTVVFYRDFTVAGSNELFRISKIYRFHPGEYLFEFEIEIKNSVNNYIPLEKDSYAYTLHIGPQIGPPFQKLDQRTEYRKFSYLRQGRRKNENITNETYKVITDQVQWVATHGKYFAVIVVPGATSYDITLSGQGEKDLNYRASLFLSRPVVRSSVVSDVFRVYVGPKVKSVMNRYDVAEKNNFNVQALNFTKLNDTRFLFGWLEAILKVLLQLLYSIIPNYGVAIILLTILVKIVMMPLTNKSMNSASKMQGLNPQIKQLREQYSDDPAKLNKELGELYKRAGVSPLSGCLPMLIQFPFFIAMFGLFSNHFDLRGASFIPGWIDDLSLPEYILEFGFSLPMLGWDSLRLLPIIFVLSQIFTAELTSNSAQASSDKQAKFMKYGLPIVFFFILYNMPSGLLVYWIFSNIFSVLQQVMMQWVRHRK